jgi:hypothetical protein
MRKKLDGEQNDISCSLCAWTSRKNFKKFFFLDRVVTGDETWCYQYVPEAKRPSVKWRLKNSPRAKQATDVEVQDKNNVHLLFRHQEYHPF